MPNPSDYDNESDWMAACVSARIDEGNEQDQAVAACLNIWREHTGGGGKSMDDTLIAYGSEVKALGNGRVGGYLVRFTSADDPDLTGDFFDAATDFGPADSTVVYYAHGQDRILRKRRLGGGQTFPLTRKDAGIWLEAQLDLADEYERAIYALTKKGKAGWSSGTASHLVEREAVEDGKAYHIAYWPLGLDGSITVEPAEPRNRAVPLKSIDWASLPDLEPEADAVEATAAKGADGHVTVNVTINQPPGGTEPEDTMNDENKGFDPEVWAAKQDALLSGKLETMQAGFDDKLTAILDQLGRASQLKGGYIAPDSEKGSDHPETKSFGDYLLALRYGNHKRLREVYQVQPAEKALGEQSGITGGYLVPTDYEARLMMMAAESAVVRPLATVIPVSTNRGEIPALNQDTAPTAGKGQTAFAGGVRMYWTPEAGSITSTDPVFRLIEWNINKVGGYTKISNELLSDSAISLENLLTRLFGMAITAVEDYAFLRGTGAGEPLGILAAPCTIAITTNTDNQFMTEDCMAMLARFWPTPGSRSIRWILQRALIPDLYVYHTVAVAGRDAIQPTEPLPGTLLGYPYVFSEHMPAANTDDAILADLAAYCIFDRQGMVISFSEHYGFITDESTWRVTKRLDGQPWLDGPIYLADPGGATTVSPFLYHDD